jgi:hydroxymethylpyrimidine pyrophosphatase-like HAD family hydrolase
VDAALAAIQEALKTSKDKDDKEVIPELGFLSLTATTNGSIILTFNQETLAPKKIDPEIYKHIFKIWLESYLDDTRYQGVMRADKHNASRILTALSV